MYKIEQTELSERVYQELRQMILRRQLGPGQKLGQERLAARLGISRTPLLSALSKLEKEMLVEIVPRHGAYVKKLTGRELNDLYDIRLRLEPLAAARAAEWADEAQITELCGYLERFERQVFNSTGEQIAVADYELHLCLLRMSRNRVLSRMISSFIIIIACNFQAAPRSPEIRLNEHRAIAEAIESHDPRLAESLMYEHILGEGRNSGVLNSS